VGNVEGVSLSRANEGVRGYIVSSPSGVQGGVLAKKTNLMHSKCHRTVLFARHCKSWEQHLTSWGAVCHKNWAVDSRNGYSGGFKVALIDWMHLTTGENFARKCIILA